MNARFRPHAFALVIAVAAVIALAASSAHARGPISYNNPFRSFNIGGVNYGSMQWERQHRTRNVSSAVVRRGGLFRRR
ncbi:MAG: hypothetical protein CMJ58_20385 [Planctomycetaceae bacterium]|nr:hypothetical protein [Planctomycetaceae bacterium]